MIWMKKKQPNGRRFWNCSLQGWDGTTTYCGWEDVPSIYLLCEKDAVLPEAVQLQMAGLAGSELVRCGAGHMPMLSMPGMVVEIISNSANRL
jgi:hypothetical protein